VTAAGVVLLAEVESVTVLPLGLISATVALPERKDAVTTIPGKTEDSTPEPEKVTTARPLTFCTLVTLLAGI
jgi:hypothetical protein